MADLSKPSGVLERCRALRGKWGTREKKFTEWYAQLTLHNNLEQEGMESVISNDPRTGYNLAKHLLIGSNIAHRIPSENLEANEQAAVGELERYMTERWTEQEINYRHMGRQSWLGQLVGLMLAFGWYNVFAMVEKDRIWAEVWHPAQCYPNYDDGVLVEHARIYRMSSAAANFTAKAMGKVDARFNGTTTLYNFWGFDADNVPVNSVVLGSDFIKKPTKEEHLHRLPIFSSPIGGLPDMGSIGSASEYQKHWGEPLLATNEDIQNNYNKMLTYLQQLIRDTANPRWFEQSSGATPILTPETVFKRGGIFYGGPNDAITPLGTPPIPVEIQQMMFNYQNMQQRGMFPYAVYGNIQQQISSLAMANIASASLQVLMPYMDGIRGVLSDVDNFWDTILKETGWTPHDFKRPTDLPDKYRFDVQAQIEIPGHLVHRATVAKMLSPDFEVDNTTTAERLFPEIKDPAKMFARTRRDKAMSHPLAIQADQVIAYKEQAKELREAGQIDHAEVYEALATRMMSELSGAPPQQPQAPTRREAGNITGPDNAELTERPTQQGGEPV
ncbi:hypothetical protein LCGC14_0316220 [marine sediment metagenome]|uniref:Uncharacterized protein n=1 Tax=marine sediment metagenome TaxID=412755 RepID=A0A0F9TKE7_9ZZZZ